MSLSKRLRFKIFRRDGYACVYCGRRAPSVTLEVDHRIPRCKGGSDHPDNLVSACWDCNRGKGPLVSDSGYQPETLDQWKYEMADLEEPWPDEVPSWMVESRRLPRPLKFDFDVYQAAAELAPAEQIVMLTPEAVIRKAELF